MLYKLYNKNWYAVNILIWYSNDLIDYIVFMKKYRFYKNKIDFSEKMLLSLLIYMFFYYNKKIKKKNVICLQCYRFTIIFIMLKNVEIVYQLKFLLIVNKLENPNRNCFNTTYKSY